MNYEERKFLMELLDEGKKIYKIEFLLKPEGEFKAPTVAKIYKNLSIKYNIFLTIPDMQQEHIGEDISEYLFFVEGDIDINTLRQDVEEACKDEEVIDIFFIQKLLKEDLEVTEVIGTNDIQQKEEIQTYSNTEQIKELRTKENEQENKKIDSVRIDIYKLNNLTNLAGELITCKSQLSQILNGFKEINVKDKEISNLISNLEKGILRLERISFELQEGITSLRLLPIKNVFRKLPRIVREVAQKEDKEVELIIKGEETEIDKLILEKITDPLVHIVRNCVNHGIEKPEERIAKGKKPQGRITIEAYAEGEHIYISITDDGRGIDIDKIKAKALEKGIVTSDELLSMSEKDVIDLIFLPGFSTADRVDDIAGRGVGMDVVKKNIAELKGEIKVETQKDKGTSFLIVIPLTVAIIKTLLVLAGERLYLLPLEKIIETVKINKNLIKSITGKKIYSIKGEIIPFFSLNEILGNEEDEDTRNYYFGIIVRYNNSKVGIIVDKLIGEYDVVVKPLDQFVGNIKGIVGSTILGDGRVVLLLEPEQLIGRIVCKAKQ
ncbi:putative CheA signal transduction histidine kinase [Caldicellulosiruptor saccharolyticus DSM 8903]|uniref:Chemotaxis protein CheA n=1 Tax=Caldicellulosiruptor saccharolyticus (strain ATCC 43494 / DSM 8903 / Tp8T 6331) TaxID=351627 RepID=A4XHP7_CALS8|nr:chemotaxis protein CheA [Caldicellulosiruptor saccharolyticus]ABP66432.1 putative CheA signal transduction histidine kinase [Caldicellulosiruptor saccharolyticus DSM 8903]